MTFLHVRCYYEYRAVALTTISIRNNRRGLFFVFFPSQNSIAFKFCSQLNVKVIVQSTLLANMHWDNINICYRVETNF